MAGHLSVRGIDGDLWNRVVLLDARLDDAEGVETIYAPSRRRRGSTSRALWYRRVHVRELRVEGARLTMRHLADNRLNLAALGQADSRPSAVASRREQQAEHKPPPSRRDRPFPRAGRRCLPPAARARGAIGMAWPHGTFDIDGAARFAGADMHFRVDRLVSDARDPLHAHVELRGGPEGHDARHGRAARPRSPSRTSPSPSTSDGSELARLQPDAASRAAAGSCTPRAAGRSPICTRTRSSTGRAAASPSTARCRGCSPACAGRRDVRRRRSRSRGRLGAGHAAAGASTSRSPAPARATRATVTLERLDADGGGVHVAARGQQRLRRARQRSCARVGRLAGGARRRSACASTASTSSTAAYGSSATLGRDAAGPRVDGRVTRRRLDGASRPPAGDGRAQLDGAGTVGAGSADARRARWAATSRSPASASPSARSR